MSKSTWGATYHFRGGVKYFKRGDGTIYHWLTAPCDPVLCPKRCARYNPRVTLMNVLANKINAENANMPSENPAENPVPESTPLNKVDFDPSQLVIYSPDQSTDSEKIQAMMFRRAMVQPILAGLAKSHARENILLHGAVGCGKTHEANYYAQERMKAAGVEHAIERVQLTRAQDDWSLLGTFSMREGVDQGVWIDGPATRAMRDGVPLIIDEIDLGDIVEDLLVSILDGSDFGARIPLPDGSYVEPKPGFMVVATSNKPADTLNFRIRNRLSAVPVNVPSKEMIGALPEDLRRPCLAVYLKAENGGDIDVTYRDFARYGRFRETVGPELVAANYSEHDVLLTCAMLAIGKSQIDAQRFLETLKLGSR